MSEECDSRIDSYIEDLFPEGFYDIEDMAEKLSFFYFYRSYSEKYPTPNNMSFFEGAFVSYIVNKLVSDWESVTKKQADHNLISNIASQLASRQEEIYDLYRKKIASKNI